MAIHIASAPAEGAKVVERNLRLPIGEVVQPTHIEVASPLRSKAYPVFTAGLEDVLGDKSLLRSGRLSAWQYLVFRGETLTALAEVAKGRPWRYASQQSAAVAQAVLEAITRAGKVDQVKANDFELRVFRIPELYFLAVWLHSADEDLLLPVRPFTKSLWDGDAFTEKQVVEALRPLAKIRAATPDA
jgi:hypothetical protein